MKKYEEIESYIKNRISTGELTPGDKVEGVPELCEMFSVSHITVQKAMSNLLAGGYIERIKGKGTYIKRSSESKDLKNIVFIIPVDEELPDNQILSIINGMRHIAKKIGYNLLIDMCHSGTNNEINTIRKHIEQGDSGIMINSANPNKLNQEIILEKLTSVPLVMVDFYADNSPCSCVSTNNFDGSYSATEYLIKHGHRKIAYLNSYAPSEIDIRYQGYKAALSSFNIGTHYHFSLLENGLDILKDLIIDKKITAVFANNDRTALHLENHLIKNDIKVPNDCSIIGFDDNDISKYAYVPLTTVKQFYYDMGCSSVYLIDEIINAKKDNNEIIYKKIFLPVRIIERDSVSKI